MATFALHVEARQASALGEGFYTIGPCGEELLGAVGLVLRPDDGVALHYRHLATQVARHARPLLETGGGESPLASTAALAPLFLDRARGYVVSSLDPVTGGAHCALGGGPHDFLVTSTLASQATPAVGRALAPGLMGHLNVADRCLFPPKAISYVSVGDGSVNNAHFLAAVNFAK
jgi:2-oxoisovalerate dehydrogenase E1 component